LRKSYQEVQKRKRSEFSIPSKMKLPIVWTIFFAVIGIIQQSLIVGSPVFLQFFTTGYFEWFSLFGSFAKIYSSGVQQVIITFLRTWYYFFFTGGLVALIWSIIYVIVFREKKTDF